MRGPRNKGDSGFLAAIALVAFLLLIQVAFWIAVIYVAVHFIFKFW